MIQLTFVVIKSPQLCELQLDNPLQLRTKEFAISEKNRFYLIMNHIYFDKKYGSEFV
jgi:hypothetical protein